ncbi:hypothetical protein C8Q75DRAFT_214029 [Abortiporus biennis]|nr:hypothetical protein C8Q75DRAFT_214029 [Abortiporus biennis]
MEDFGDIDIAWPGFERSRDENHGDDCVELMQTAISNLPRLSREDLKENLDDSCPICLVPFENILGSGKREGGGGGLLSFGGFFERREERENVVDDGVTRLEGCGHVFCRSDLIAWILGFHGTCPTCRNPFIHFPIIEDSEEEDEDYIPDDDEMDTDVDFLTDEELEDWMDTVDADITEEEEEEEEEEDGVQQDLPQTTSEQQHEREQDDDAAMVEELLEELSTSQEPNSNTKDSSTSEGS